MFNGDTVAVTLRMKASVMSSVLDRFGKNLLVTKASDGVATACVTVMESPTFYGWLTQFGDEVTLVSPENSPKKVHGVPQEAPCRLQRKPKIDSRFGSCHQTSRQSRLSRRCVIRRHIRSVIERATARNTVALSIIQEGRFFIASIRIGCGWIP